MTGALIVWSVTATCGWIVCAKQARIHRKALQSLRYLQRINQRTERGAL